MLLKSCWRSDVICGAKHLVGFHDSLGSRHCFLSHLSYMTFLALSSDDLLEFCSRQQYHLPESFWSDSVVRYLVNKQRFLGESIQLLQLTFNDASIENFNLSVRDQDGCKTKGTCLVRTTGAVNRKESTRRRRTSTNLFSALHDIIIWRVDTHLGALYQRIQESLVRHSHDGKRCYDISAHEVRYLLLQSTRQLNEKLQGTRRREKRDG